MRSRSGNVCWRKVGAGGGGKKRILSGGGPKSMHSPKQAIVAFGTAKSRERSEFCDQSG